MSGGSHDYVCYAIEENLSGQMKDPELNELVKDLSSLAHDLEWADSGDIEWSDYFDSVKKFKEKWFVSPRDDRLISIVNNKIDELRDELHKMIGG